MATVTTVALQAAGPEYVAARDLSRSPDGRLWVLDAGSGAIRVWSEASGSSRTLDLTGPRDERILDPSGLDAGSGLGFQVADRSTGSLYRFDHNGVYLGGVSFRLPAAGSRTVQVRVLDQKGASTDRDITLNPESVLVLGADRSALLSGQRDAVILHDGLEGEALLVSMDAGVVPPASVQGDILLLSPHLGQFTRMDPAGGIRWTRSVTGVDLGSVAAMTVQGEDVVLLSAEGLIRLAGLLSSRPSLPIRADFLQWGVPGDLRESGASVDLVTGGNDIWILTERRLWKVVRSD